MITWDQNSGTSCTTVSFGGTGSKCQSENVTFNDLLSPCQLKVCPVNDQCSNYTCNVLNGTAVCNRTVAVGKSCTDSLFCSTASTCNSAGNCVGSTFVNCGSSPNPCQNLVCQETVNNSVCVSIPKPNGTSCSSGNVCKFGGSCQAGNCIESNVPCPSNTTCAEYACISPSGCTMFPRTNLSCGVNDVCQTHLCNSLGLCVDMYSSMSTPCGSGETICQYSSHCDGIGGCSIGDLKPNNTLCSNCTGCLQAAYCSGLSPICPSAVVLPCASVNCSVGSCRTDGECGCDYTILDCHDTNACTQDFCNITTGECYHPLLDCPPVNAEPNQCISYSCNSDDEEFPCEATPRNGERCEVDTNQCLYGVCVSGYNTSWCNENPFDPIPLPPPVSECCYYACDPEMGIFPVCNTSSPCNAGDQCYNYGCTLNPNTTECGCTLISAKPHPPNTECTIYVCNPILGWIADHQNGLSCGSSTSTVCNLPDTCLGGNCQSNHVNSSVQCTGETLCRYAAYCTGTGTCSTQLDKPDGLSCGPSFGFCDTGNICSSGSCVTNYTANGALCGLQTECHLHDTCNGIGACIAGPSVPDGTSCGVTEAFGSRNCSSGVCVNILLSGNICNASQYDCQLDALCSGDNFFCPDRFPVDAGVLCESGSGCTPSSFCDGVNFTCHFTEPIECDDSNACTLDSCVFNASTGQSACAYQNLSCYDSSLCTGYNCDPLVGCVGMTVQCNDNNTCTVPSCINGSGCQFTPLPAATECDDGDLCTENDVCGPHANCSGSPKCKPTQCGTVTCSLGACVFSPANQTLNCTPVFAQTCPGGQTPCLVGYTCQGLSCMPVYHSALTICRVAVDDCDLPDYCSGSSACCPLDVKATNGASCGTGEHVCGAERCFNGVCNQVDLNTGAICNASSNPCEQDALCQSGQVDCPGKESIVPCCLDNDECGTLEACEDNVCVVQPQGCELDGCFDNVGCMMGTCNETTKLCDYRLDDLLCQEEDICMVYSCSPVVLCLSGVNVGQQCSDNANCSRPARTETHWDCSLNFIEYPSLVFCQIACVFGVCSQEDVFIPAINGTCGPPLQIGCLATPIEDCCYEDLDCYDSNITDCVFQSCTDNHCEHYTVEAPDCCQSDSECGVAEGCSYYTCSANACFLVSIECEESEESSSSSLTTSASDPPVEPMIPQGEFPFMGEVLIAAAPALCLLGIAICCRRRHRHHHRHVKDR